MHAVIPKGHVVNTVQHCGQSFLGVERWENFDGTGSVTFVDFIVQVVELVTSEHSK